MIYLLLFTFSFGTILHVDGNSYLTIQSAIDDSQEGDTVLVYNGIYFENLDIDKTITLTSLAMYDNLDLWYEYDTVSEQYEISNSNILNTIIDGSQPIDDDFQSGIIIRSTENDCISPVIMGLTIRNGMGTMVTEEIPHTAVRMIGGGLFSYITNATIHHNQFTNNGTPGLQNGGAIYLQTSEYDWDFDNRSSGSPRCEINEINLHDNFYRDNDAIYGNTVSNRTFTEEINLTNSLFDIYNCSEQNVTNVWVDLHPAGEADFTGIQGDNCAILGDVWVSPMGSDYNGLATENSPVKTIKYALEIIAPTESNHINIYLDEGTYSPSSNGETYPIRMISNVNFNGEGEELTSLNAENTARVIIMENCNNNIISNLMIEGGIPPGIFSDNSGGGITAISSNPTITNVTFTGNNAISGAGLNLYESNATLNYVTISGNIAHLSGGGVSIISSSPIFNDVVITDNITTVGRGGGMYIDNSITILNQVTISGNTAVDWGGGIVLYNSNSILSNMTISNNVSDFNGGGMGIDNSNPTLNNITVSGNTSTYGGGMYLYQSNPIMTNSIIWYNLPQSIYLDSGEPIVSFSDIEEGWEGNDNINVPPLFLDSENGDYTLHPNSPCIDAGISYLELDGEIIVSLDGSEYYGPAPDMGAYEYYPLSIDKPVEILPIEYLLEYPYPNPFNPTTSISFSIPEKSQTSITIFDINGTLISTLLNKSMNVGHHQIEWNAKGYPSGVYFVKLVARDFIQTQKLMLVK